MSEQNVSSMRHDDGMTYTLDEQRRLKREGWQFVVRAYYGDEAVSPKRTGELAFETVHRTESSKDMEVNVAESRQDIGKVEVTPL